MLLYNEPETLTLTLTRSDSQRLAMRRFGSVVGTLSFFLSVFVSLGSESMLSFGLTNTAIGQAILNTNWDGSQHYVSNLGSNGLDGLSIALGESDSGVFLAPSLHTDPVDGHYMKAKAYGTLNGAANQLLSTIQGGRATATVYPLEIDLSPLAPESVTYEVRYGDIVMQRFTRGQPIVFVNYGANPGPRVNPCYRQPDGTIGVLLEFQDGVQFVFPDALGSGWGDRLFIRANNPSNHVDSINRVDTFGGGGLPEFYFDGVLLGMFYRPHRAYGGAVFNAESGRLRVSNLENGVAYDYAFEPPGIFVELEKVSAFSMGFIPFELPGTNAAMAITAFGHSGGNAYTALGTLGISVRDGTLNMAVEQGLSPFQQIDILKDGLRVASSDMSSQDLLATVATNTRIRGIHLQTKTAQALPGFHVRFDGSTRITVSTNGPSYDGDEVAFLLGNPARFETFESLNLVANNVQTLTITNETAFPQVPPPPLQIARAANDTVTLSWLDPNRLYRVQGTVSPWALPPWWYFEWKTNFPAYSDPYATLSMPIIRTNQAQFFRLNYSPSGD